jgi:hypothetical protein
MLKKNKLHNKEYQSHKWARLATGEYKNCQK